MSRADPETDDRRRVSLRRLYEGAVPNAALLAEASGFDRALIEDWVEQDEWRPVPKPSQIRRHMTVLTDRTLEALDQPQLDDAAAEKAHLDGVAARLRVIDKLAEHLRDLDGTDEDARAQDAFDLDHAMTLIDQRIDELAHDYADKLGTQDTDTERSSSDRGELAPAGAPSATATAR